MARAGQKHYTVTVITEGLRTLFIAAHPDDIETMMGYAVIQTPGPRFALVASDGEKSTRNFTASSRFVSRGRRRSESRRGLSALGIIPSHQFYLALPDLSLSSCLDELASAIATVLIGSNIQQLFSLGPHGYDGHIDHVAVHSAAVEAVKKSRRRIGLFALDRSHRGKYIVHTDNDAMNIKLSAMACHLSQFAIDASQPTGRDKMIGTHAIPVHAWQYLRPYRALLLKAETYELIFPRSGKPAGHLVK